MKLSIKRQKTKQKMHGRNWKLEEGEPHTMAQQVDDKVPLLAKELRLVARY